MSSPEGIILEQFYDELKEKGIKVGNKVKLRSGNIDTIIRIDYRKYGNSYPIILSAGSSHTVDGSLILGQTSIYDVVDWNYKEPEDITPNNYDELKEKGIEVGNKVKLRNGEISEIVRINTESTSKYCIKLAMGSTHTIKGSYSVVVKSDYDIVDWDYKEPIEDNLTSNNPDVSYLDKDENTSPDVFIKHDKGKPMISLIDPKFIEGLAEVMTQGASKYGRDNWQECKEPHRYLDALLRHTLKYWDGEKVDTESGKSHLYHIAFNAMALDYLDNKLKD